MPMQCHCIASPDKSPLSRSSSNDRRLPLALQFSVQFRFWWISLSNFTGHLNLLSNARKTLTGRFVHYLELPLLLDFCFVVLFQGARRRDLNFKQKIYSSVLHCELEPKLHLEQCSRTLFSPAFSMIWWTRPFLLGCQTFYLPYLLLKFCTLFFKKWPLSPAAWSAGSLKLLNAQNHRFGYWMIAKLNCKFWGRSLRPFSKLTK